VLALFTGPQQPPAGLVDPGDAAGMLAHRRTGTAKNPMGTLADPFGRHHHTTCPGSFASRPPAKRWSRQGLHHKPGAFADLLAGRAFSLFASTHNSHMTLPQKVAA